MPRQILAPTIFKLFSAGITLGLSFSMALGNTSNITSDAPIETSPKRALNSPATDTCLNRGDLATPYCDSDFNLVADTPANPALWLNPDPLIISITPNEDPLSYAHEMGPFYTYLESCLSRQVIFYPLQSSEAEIDAMKNNRIHVASFSSGTTIIAVNKAGAIPFATNSNEQGIMDTKMLIIVRADSPYQQLNELKGSRIAHVNATSNTGHFAPLALLPAAGLIPNVDYEPLYSGKHNRSILGVKSGDYEAAAIASEVLDRMVQRQEVSKSDFRVLYESDSLPSSSFSYAYNLAPALQDSLKKCFYQYQFPPSMSSAFLGATHFSPIQYQENWETAREIMKHSRQP